MRLEVLDPYKPAVFDCLESVHHAHGIVEDTPKRLSVMAYRCRGDTQKQSFESPSGDSEVIAYAHVRTRYPVVSFVEDDQLEVFRLETLDPFVPSMRQRLYSCDPDLAVD